MPQPFLPQYDGRSYSVGFEALKSRPQLAEAIGKIIGVWSHVSYEIAFMFANLLGSDSPVAHRVFVLLRRWQNQQDVLDAAAEARLTGEALAVYRALAKEYGSLEKQRNDLAHFLPGYIEDDPNLLLIVSLGEMAAWHVEIVPKLDRHEAGPDPHRGLKENMRVYSLPELKTRHADMESLWYGLHHFNGYLRDPQPARRDRDLRRVLGQPYIQRHLAQQGRK